MNKHEIFHGRQDQSAIDRFMAILGIRSYFPAMKGKTENRDAYPKVAEYRAKILVLGGLMYRFHDFLSR
jgi:hypothetical protein